VRKAVRFALAQPGAEARLLWRKLLLAWNGYEVPDNYDQAYFARESWILRGYLPGFLWIAPLAALGFALSIREWRRSGLLHLFVLAYLLSLLALYVTSRYRLPILAGLIPLAAHGAVRLADMVRRRAWRRVVPSGALVAGVFLVGSLELVEPQGFAKEETELATFYADRGDTEAAERAFERAIREAKGSGSLHLVYMNQGFFFARAGRTSEAEEAFRNALRANPSFTPARIELEKLQARRGGALSPP
jgi:tetratricopeptide (TPR) repeat protein